MSFRCAVGLRHWTGLCRVAAKRQRRSAGTTLIWQGAPPEYVLLLDRGRTVITRANTEGRSTMVALRGPGDLLGEFSFIDGGPRSATVLALDDCEVFYLPAANFDSYLRRNNLRNVVEHYVVGKARQGLDRRSEQLINRKPVVLVAGLLTELIAIARSDDRMYCIIPATRANVAGWLGIAPRSVDNALRVLKGRALVDTGVRRITVLDEAGLARLAQAD